MDRPHKGIKSSLERNFYFQNTFSKKILRMSNYTKLIRWSVVKNTGGLKMGKMDKKWVYLCSAAVAAVYATGYFSTETEATKVAMQQQVPLKTEANVDQASVDVSNNKQTISLYKDGTFTGMGANRRGSIEVAVTIQNDKITDVEISQFGMHYSESDVVGLPDEVLQNQNAQVANVSGATYSTEAFKDAVKDALSQAQNA